MIKMNAIGLAISVAATLCMFTKVNAQEVPFQPIRINSGGPETVDSAGNVWAQDQFFTDGVPYFTGSTQIVGTLDDPLYLTERYGDFSYAISVPPGDYTIKLRFAEIYWFQAGRRSFDVNVEGVKVLDRVDLVDQVGALTAFDILHDVTVTDGVLDIVFTTRIDNAKISAVEILDGSPGTADPFLDVRPANLDFGLGNVNETGAQLPVALTNTGGALLTVDSIALSGPDAASFRVTAEPSYTLAPGGSRTFAVAFAPTVTGDRTATLTLSGNSSGGDVVLDLTGTGVAPQTPAVAVEPTSVNVGVVEIGVSGADSVVRVDSVGTGSVEITSVTLEGPDATFFSLAGAQPVTLPVGSSTTFAVHLTPDTARLYDAALRVVGTDPGGDVLVPLSGEGVDPPTEEILVNAGGADFTDGAGKVWQADVNFAGGTPYTSIVDVAGTQDDELFRTERYGTFGYSVPTGNGRFEVTLLFAEIYWTAPGSRVFDVRLEGSTVATGLDLVVAAGPFTAHEITVTVDVQDGVLSAGFDTLVDNAKLSALRIVRVDGGPDPGVLSVSPTNLNFEVTAPGAASEPLTVTLSNQGGSELDVTSILTEGLNALDFDVNSAGSYALAPGTSASFDVRFAPQAPGDRSASLRIVTTTPQGDVLVPMFGVGDPNPGQGFMHAVAGPDQTVTDVADDGFETVTLDGAGSHTHEPGVNLVSWTWRENGQLIAVGPIPDVVFSVGVHTVEHTVQDEFGKTATDVTTVTVVDASRVPGLLAYYYEGLPSPSVLPDFAPLTPTFGEVVSNVHVPNNATSIGGAPSFLDLAVVYLADLDVPVTGSYLFEVESDDGSRLLVDGAQVVANDGLHGMQKAEGLVQLTAGTHALRLEYFQAGGSAGVILRWKPPGGTLEIVPPSVFLHSAKGVRPVLSTALPAESPEDGGALVTITGLGFEDDPVAVHFGASTVTSDAFLSRSFGTLEVTAPAGVGVVDLFVSTSQGDTRSVLFRYGNDVPPPIDFVTSGVAQVSQPTSLAFGPDGRLYVASVDGTITAHAFDAAGDVSGVDVYSAVQDLGQGRVILGIAFNPASLNAQPEIYVAHTKLFDPNSLYPGKVSILRGPDFDVLEDVITGLPASEHDHGNNGMDFGPLGEMYHCVGGNTNGGIPDASLGLRDESVLSASVVVAHIEQPGFDGAVTYDQTTNPFTANQTGGFGVEIFSPGHRNAYDLLFHSNGNLYVTDNGPNGGFGAASLDCNLTGPDPQTGDELNLVRQGRYYGHPNRNRGRSDPRQCIFRSANAGPGAGYTQPIQVIPSSSNGIAEYTANTFGGQMRGQILIVQFNQDLRRYELSADGEIVIDEDVMGVGGLDVAVGPHGGIFVCDYTSGVVTRYKPVEPPPTTFTIRDTFPNRGTVAGGRVLKITGTGFGPAGAVTAKIGSVTLPVSSVSSTEIVGLLPPGAGAGAVDVTVTSQGVTKTFTNGFRYVGVGTGVTGGRWDVGPSLPQAYGEVTTGCLGNQVVVTGDGRNDVHVFDVSSNQWTLDVPPLPASFPASDHTMGACVDGRFYVLGGLNPPSAAVYCYDPATGQWTQVSSIESVGQVFALGASAVGVIGTRIYLAGGLTDELDPTGVAMVYETQTDTWTDLPALPLALNHAGGVGYAGKLWVLGGRPGGDFVHPGSDAVQVFDPITGSWDSTTYQLPTARAATGSAVAVNGRILLMGGEGGGPAGGLFPHLEALDPVNNVWSRLEDMPFPVHGHQPVLVDGKIYVAGGGPVPGASNSARLQIYTPPGSADISPPSVTVVQAQGQVFQHAPQITIDFSDNALLLHATARVDDGPVNLIVNDVGSASLPGFLHVLDDVTFHALPNGLHTLRVEVFDASGNVGVTNWSFFKGQDPQSNVRINCGGLAYTDSLGQIWLGDQGHTGGSVYSVSAGIAGTNSDPLYQTERYGQFAYQFDVPNGTYTVNLHFAEIYTGTFAVGARVFSFDVENQIVLADYDVYAQSGGNTAVVKSYQVQVTDGALTVTSVPGVENPKLSAIEFFPDTF